MRRLRSSAQKRMGETARSGRLSEGCPPERLNRRGNGGCLKSLTLDVVDVILKGEAYHV